MTLPHTSWSKIDTIRQVPPHLLSFNFSKPTASVPKAFCLPSCYNGRSVHALLSGQPLQLCPSLLAPAQGLALTIMLFFFLLWYFLPLHWVTPIDIEIGLNIIPLTKQRRTLTLHHHILSPHLSAPCRSRNCFSPLCIHPSHSLLSTLQSASRLQHATETALPSVANGLDHTKPNSPFCILISPDGFFSFEALSSPGSWDTTLACLSCFLPGCS